MYFNSENYSESLRYFYLAKESYLKSGNELLVALAISNIGFIYLKNSSSYEKALSSFKSLLEISIKLKNEQYISMAYINIANIYLKFENYKVAIKFINKAKFYYRKSNNSLGLLECDYIKCEIKLKQGKLFEARKISTNNIIFADELKDNELISKVNILDKQIETKIKG